MSATSPPPLVLTFAASDPTGGAGVQADVLAIAALGCHPLSVITALTVQDTVGVSSVHPVAAQLVDAQARALIADLPAHAIKLGVLATPQNVEAVAAILRELRNVPVVVDPVLASGRGDALAGDDTARALCELIFPLCTVVTPNSVEARRLSGMDALEDCARELLRMGSKYVLITGSHEDTGDVVVNTLYHSPSAQVVRREKWPRLPASYHGSGCTLASALACGLARGMPVDQAAHEAQAFTWRSLKAGFLAGRGQHLPNRSSAGSHNA